MKLCVSQQPLELRQNHLHLCVHRVVGIIRKIVIWRFEQLRDLIFLCTWQAVNKVKFEDEIVRISTTVRATAKPFTPLCSPSGRDNHKNCDFPIWTTSWPYFFMAVNKVKFEDEIVHISTTVRATAKPFTPLCSPSGRDNHKNCDFPIWTTSWPYFFMAVNKVKFEDEIVHISTTVRATAKPFTPLCSPSGSDNQKMCDFPIWTTYFFMVLATCMHVLFPRVQRKATAVICFWLSDRIINQPQVYRISPRKPWVNLYFVTWHYHKLNKPPKWSK